MFICKTNCIEKFEGSAVEWAKAIGRVSYGPCEICRTTDECFDVKGDYKRKEKKQ